MPQNGDLNHGRKTIIYITPHRNLYGAERSLISMMRGVRENGYFPVLVMGGTGIIEEALKKEKIDYIIHPFCQWINMEGSIKPLLGFKNYLKNMMYARQLATKLQNNYSNIVLVHSNSIISDFGCHLARVLKVPHVFHVREFGKLDFNMSFNLGDKLSAKIINRSAKVICISDAVLKYYSEILDRNKLVRIYNGIPISRSLGNRKENEKFRFILVGRISKEKGQEDVIRAVSKIANKKIEVDFYGNGVDEVKLRKFTNDLSLESIINFKGFQADIPYECYDAAIMASTAEAFGRVTVEYMLHSLPVIGTNTGATPELIDEGITGVLYDMGDISQLTCAMEKMISNKEECIRMGKAAREKAIKSFSEERYWSEIIKTYHEIEAKRGK